MNGRPKVFLSYRRSEHARVLAVKQALDGAGVDAFLDTEAIDPLDDFPKRIAQAIGASHVLLAWWSRDYAESDHCLAEFKLGWQHARRHGPNVGRRVWVLNPETGAGHVTAGELDASNFLRPPAPGAEAAWVQTLLPRLADLLPEGPLDDERGALAAPGPQHPIPIGAEHFVGRNAELMRIHSLTHPPKIGDAARDVAVRTHGLGGVGKTELALQYARQFCAAYPGGVFWLNLASFEPERYLEAGHIESGQAAWADAVMKCLGQDEVLRARLLDTEDKPLPPATMRARIAAHFDGKHSPAFLWVLDNVPTLLPEDLRDELLAFWRAPGATGRTLLTTRDGAAMTGFQPLRLEVLGGEDALRLLALHRRPASTAERQVAESLVEQLGCHPQALTLLARWIAMAVADQPYASAAASIKEAGALAHIETIASRLADQLGDKARGIVAAFKTSIAALDADAKELLALAAVCGPNAAIPRGLLGAAFGPAARADDCALALDHLHRRGLLTERSGGEAAEIHPLVAEAVLLLLKFDEAARGRLEDRVVQALLGRLDQAAQPKMRDQLANDVGQALHLALRCESEGSVRLGLRAGQYFRANGRFPQAARIERHVLEKSRRLFGDENPITLAAMNNLASTLLAQGDLAGALELQKSVLATQRRLLGAEHPHTLTSMNNLAETLRAQGDLAGALELQQSALATQRRLLGEDHPDTLSPMNNLAG
ncbi:MAG: toll/interleukin-1 receptor domain-containing protein, partial [Sulfuritalea sp.]|nr:toll/interleukin-1 receptor domain-containing protein [Sulfuritalea sp.]